MSCCAFAFAGAALRFRLRFDVIRGSFLMAATAFSTAAAAAAAVAVSLLAMLRVPLPLLKSDDRTAWDRVSGVAPAGATLWIFTNKQPRLVHVSEGKPTIPTTTNTVNKIFDRERENEGVPSIDFGAILRQQPELTALRHEESRQFELPPLDGAKARFLHEKHALLTFPRKEFAETTTARVDKLAKYLPRFASSHT